MTVEEFADILGVSPDLVREWENGHRIQSREMDNLMRIVFDITGTSIGSAVQPATPRTDISKYTKTMRPCGRISIPDK